MRVVIPHDDWGVAKSRRKRVNHWYHVPPDIVRWRAWGPFLMTRGSWVWPHSNNPDTVTSELVLPGRARKIYKNRREVCPSNRA